MDDSTREKFAASVRSALRTEAYIKGQMCYLGCRYKVLPNYRLTQMMKAIPTGGLNPRLLYSVPSGRVWNSRVFISVGSAHAGAGEKICRCGYYLYSG